MNTCIGSLASLFSCGDELSLLMTGFLVTTRKFQIEEKMINVRLTSNAFWDSLSIQIMAWSDVALQERTMCSNLPSTGTAVLTMGGYLPHL